MTHIMRTGMPGDSAPTHADNSVITSSADHAIADVAAFAYVLAADSRETSARLNARA